MKKTNTLSLATLILLLAAPLTFSSAFANAPAAATGAAEEVVKKSTEEMAKDAAGEVADSAKEKAIGMAKDEANKAVDTGLDKVGESLEPTEKAADAVKGASE